MAIRPIVTAPDPFLKQISAPIGGPVTDEHRALMDDMLDSMYAANGIGLAAIQVGVPLRVIVMDISSDEAPDTVRYFVNPEVYWTSEDLNTYQEGCLSVPEQYADVDRPAECKVRFLDYDGTPRDAHFTGLLATCFQHEMDHLEGVLFIDHLSSVKRSMILRKVVKAKRLTGVA